MQYKINTHMSIFKNGIFKRSNLFQYMSLNPKINTQPLIKYITSQKL